MSFADLLSHLGTLSRNILAVPLQGGHTITVDTIATSLQKEAFDLLGIDPVRTQ
jgi:hypothetical protein